MGRVTYTGRAMAWLEAERLILKGEGRYLIFVVEEPGRKTRQVRLKYGLFFEDTDGAVWEVTFTARQMVKSFSNPLYLVEEIERTAGNGFGVVVPFLKEENLFKPGSEMPKAYGKVIRLGET